jgi:site-specific DNA-methyltransferase (adenine-specific)
VTEPVIIGNATLWLGDCREILPTLLEFPEGSAILTDPPYGIGFAHGGNDNSGIGAGKYATKFAKKAIIGDAEPFDPGQLLAIGVPTILWGGNHFANRLPSSAAWLIWDKRAASGHTNDFADCEIAWSNLKGVARVFRHHWDGMMRASERGERCHPTQKPVALMEWCLLKLPDAQVILDPYMGSGTTGIACANMDRAFVGCEMDPEHFETACRRIEDAQRQQRMFA